MHLAQIQLDEQERWARAYSEEHGLSRRAGIYFAQLQQYRNGDDCNDDGINELRHNTLARWHQLADQIGDSAFQASAAMTPNATLISPIIVAR